MQIFFKILSIRNSRNLAQIGIMRGFERKNYLLIQIKLNIKKFKFSSSQTKKFSSAKKKFQLKRGTMCIYNF